MEVIKTIDIDIYALIILMIVLIGTLNRQDRLFLSYRLFIYLVLTSAAVLLLDVCLWMLDGVPGQTMHVAYITISIIFYAMHPITPLLWFLYTYNQIFRSERKAQKLFILLMIPAIVEILLTVFTLQTGWFFSIDAQNIYHRGPLFWLFIVLCYSYMIASLLMLIIEHKRIEKQRLVPMMIFHIPPLVAGILQLYYFGLALIWPGIAISLLIVFINMQNRQLTTDYLTGTFNRLYFDRHLNQQFAYRKVSKIFSGIMIDIDKFKQINDKLGHDIGDQALIATADLIRSCLRRDDFIARYGGDEFIIILDITESETLKTTVTKIKTAVDTFNTKETHPYNLSLSMGYTVCHPESCSQAEEFIKKLDSLMYEDKNKNK